MEQITSRRNLDAEREAWLKETGYTPVNKLISYGISHYGSPFPVEHTARIDQIQHWADLQIHVNLVGDLGSHEIFEMAEDSLYKLAEIVASDPEIFEVSATSRLVTMHKEWFLAKGFKIDNSLLSNTQLSVRGFSERSSAKLKKIELSKFDKRFLKTPISRVTMPRADFLQRYLKTKV